MHKVLVFTGKGGEQAKIDALAADLVESLSAGGAHPVQVRQQGSVADLPAELAHVLGQHSPAVCVAVGFTAAQSLAPYAPSGLIFVAALPDVPGTGQGPYTSALEKLADTLALADYAVVADEPSRSYLEYKIAGASGKVLTASNLSPLLSPAPEAFATERKVLFVGHDFRFIGDVARQLRRVPGLDVRLLSWELAQAEPTEEQKQAISWADTVVCEWAGRQAVWLSHHLGSGQRLLVHLHGFEADSQWIDGIDFSAVERLIVVSDFYRDQLVAARGWQREKMTVIPNTVEPVSLARAKREGAAWHLGMLGYTPFLKRPDRAVEILENLLERDERFVLHLRGDAPFSHGWLWNYRLEETDAYAELYARVAANPQLRNRVVFEGYGANVEGWLTGIGWLLSISDRETFHVAAAEGMASGAVPVFLLRAGVTDIFSDRWVFESTGAAADFIAKTVTDGNWSAESEAAQEFAQRFGVQAAVKIWREVLR